MQQAERGCEEKKHCNNTQAYSKRTVINQLHYSLRH